MTAQKTRKLAAIMFTDIVGYTALMQHDEQKAIQVRTRHREVFEKQHDLHHGEIIQYFGDGTLSIFQSAVEAVLCAIGIQKELGGKEPKVPVRIGLHQGDILYDQTEIFGDGVNVASRIENIATSGAVLISGRLNEELKNQHHILTESLGTFEFKNVVDPVEIYAITNEGILVPDRSGLSGRQKRYSKSIAVLPFVNMSSSEENEFFSDGMTEEIINALTRIRGLKVTSRTSSFYFKNKNIPIAQIGKELNVNTILEGSIRLAANRMRITAQLIDVGEDFHFWSETFDRSVDDIFAVQDEISLLIADKLREHLGHLEIEDHLVHVPDISVDLYNRYLKSRYHILNMSKSEIEKGLSILEEIIREKPDYPMAHLGIHLGYTMMGTLGYMPAVEAFTKGKPYLDKAIEIDDSLPECQLQLSWISFLQDWDLESTYHHLNKVLETRPIVDFYQTMASTLVAEGKTKAAMNYIETAIQIDPFSEINYHLKGYILYIEEKYEDAIPLFEKSLELKPETQVSIQELGQSLILLNRIDDAKQFFNNLPEATDEMLRTGGFILTLAASGEHEAALKEIDKLETALQTGQAERALYLLIVCYTLLDNFDRAIQLIEDGLSFRLPMLVYLGVDPVLKPLHRYTKFKKLMQQVLGKSTAYDGKMRKYKKSLLSPKELNVYRGRLKKLMSSEKPFLNPDLSLRDLAEILGLPANQLSQLLNEGFNRNFAEFVNTYRLEMFKSKVADPAQRHLTLLGLAYESGFNSKTAFNTFFKKAMGKTPREYWNEITGN